MVKSLTDVVVGGLGPWCDAIWRKHGRRDSVNLL